MVKGKIIKGKKKITQTSEPFKYKKILIIIGIVLVIGGIIGVVLYFTVFKNSGSSSGGGGNTPTVQPGPNPTYSPGPGPNPTVQPGPGPNPTGPPGPPGPTGPPGPPNPSNNNNKVVGAWINAANPPWSIIPNMDIIILSSFGPNPWSMLYPCTSSFSLFPTDFSALNAMVTTARSKAPVVLISIGGSSFGVDEWAGMLYKYYQSSSNSVCQCPSGSYWFGCDADDQSCCPDADKAAGKCGGSFTIPYTNSTDCCSFQSNPHKCCCGYGSTIINGKCVPNSTPIPCNVPGLINQDTYNTCVQQAGTDNNALYLCKLQNSDPVQAYADCLVATGADGLDFDYESPDPSGNLATALVKFSIDLKAEMLKRGKTIVLNITMLSGNSYGAQFGGIYDSLKTSTSPFDYAVPMLYYTPQYPYGDPTAQNTWNGLLNYWATNFLIKGVSNAKLLPAFIDCSASPPVFECSDLSHFINEYIITSPYPNSVEPSGALFFWYNDGGDYDTTKITKHISNLHNYFISQTPLICNY